MSNNHWRQRPELFYHFRVQLDYDMTFEKMKNVLHHEYDLRGVKLIARPKWDMTNGEIKNLLQWQIDSTDFKMQKYTEQEICDMIRKSFKKSYVDFTINDFLYVLSRNVYPFDNDSDVIFQSRKGDWL